MYKKGGVMGHVKATAQHPSENPIKSMSPTPIGRSRGHRSVGVGDSDLEAVKAHHTAKRLTAHVAPAVGGKRDMLSPNGDRS